MHDLHIGPEEFLSAFFQPHEIVCFQIIDDKKGSAFTGAKLDKVLGHFHKIEGELRRHNEQGRGVFFVVNLGGHAQENITRINAQFVDMDNGTPEEQEARIAAFPLPPSLVVRTARGHHCYWLMKDASLDRFRYVQRQLVKQFEGDPACVNTNRVLRVPGFNHCKGDPTPVVCIKFNPELRYTQRQLEEALPMVAEEAPSAPAAPVKDRGTQKGLKLVARCPFMKYCQKNAKTLKEPLWYAMITNLALFEGGEAVIHKLSKPHPGYSPEQTQAKIAHFHKSGTKPMTCAKIADHGFVCPKMQNGSCKCKSPAGLAYRPYEVPELKKLLFSQKKAGDQALDLLAARQFIADYMFNIDPGIAKVIIANDIKAHFGFKAAAVEDLPNYQRELYRAHMEKQEVKRDRHGEELPPWYEMSERGGLTFLPGVLADWCAENEHVIYVGDSYYFYERGVYVPKNDTAAERLIRSHMQRDRKKTSAQIADAEHQWRIEIDRDVREINPNPYIINFKNLMYNVLTDEVLPHDPKMLSTIQLAGNYDPQARCPVFLKYLSDVLPEVVKIS